MHSRLFLGTVSALFALAFPSEAQERASTTVSESMTISRAGFRPRQPVPMGQFTGTAYLEPLFAVTETSRANAAAVTFEPGARSAWHTHPRGQALIVTAGTGRVQRRGGPVEEIRAGDVIWTPAGVEHWHGAAPTTAMSHIAIQETLDGDNVHWLEKVSDEQFNARPSNGDSHMTTQSSPAPGRRADAGITHFHRTTNGHQASGHTAIQ